MHTFVEDTVASYVASLATRPSCRVLEFRITKLAGEQFPDSVPINRQVNSTLQEIAMPH